MRARAPASCGFAGPDCGTFAPAVVTEGVAVLNGKWIDGVSSGGNGEISVAEFNSVFVHEFGHYVNLDHSQIGLAEAFDADATNDEDIATMFPFLVDGGAAFTLALDDRVAVSTLYPAPGFASGGGTIRGHVFRADGTTPFQGANVVARRIGDPLVTAVSNVSGARYFPGSPGGAAPVALQGLFELPGLPPGDYTVEVEAVHPAFVGGSGVGPLSPPVTLPGPPEFWNGANEAGTSPPDDPSAAVAITVTGGATIDPIDVLLNQPAPPVHDACAAAVPIGATPFLDVRSTVAASSAGTDPQPSCTVSKNSNTVWYTYTPPISGTVTLDTSGSSYDTVLTVYTGACGAPVEVACNDDTAGGQLSTLSFVATGGTTYLVEVADYGLVGRRDALPPRRLHQLRQRHARPGRGLRPGRRERPGRLLHRRVRARRRRRRRRLRRLRRLPRHAGSRADRHRRRRPGRRVRSVRHHRRGADRRGRSRSSPSAASTTGGSATTTSRSRAASGWRPAPSPSTRSPTARR